MRQRTIWLSGLGLGAAITALAEATTHLLHRRRDTGSTVGRDLRNRTRGMVAAALHRLTSDRRDDAATADRVRSALGPGVPDPHATTAFDPHVQPAHDSSSDTVLADARTPPSPDVVQHNWAPATRAIAAGAGALLVGAGLVRRDRTGAGLAAAGAALMGRAATNLPFHRLVGIGAGGSAIDVHKAITIDLPADRVFAFWDNPANLPTVMHHVRDVRMTKLRGQWRWTVSGAHGIPIEFVTVLTERVPDRLLAWKTVEGSTVEHTGVVRFDALNRGRTRIGLRLSYNPPGSALGQAAAAVLGTDPKHQVESDLRRMKAALETGRPADDVARRA